MLTEIPGITDKASEYMRVMLEKAAISGNPIFLWEGIYALTRPEMEGSPVVLPPALRSYLNDAAQGIFQAATMVHPDDFQKFTMRALRLSDGKRQIAKSFARDRFLGRLLDIYDEFYHREGAEKAATSMAKAIRKNKKTIEDRLAFARTFDKKLRKKLGLAPRQRQPDVRPLKDVPEEGLAHMLRQLPHIYWLKRGRPTMEGSTEASGQVSRPGKAKSPRQA